MATVATNPIMNGLSGMLGKTIVFKNWRNKTIVASYSAPSKKQSEAQRANRSKFREAANWAHAVLNDPERKAYYQKKARKLGLPNAYTAAITDYMRKPQISNIIKREGATSCFVYKKDFAVKSAEVNITAPDGTTASRTVQALASGECWIQLNDIELNLKIKVFVVDAAGRRLEVLTYDH